MFCPECGAEYRTGIVECTDCHIRLVEELTQGSSGAFRDPNPDLKLMKVFETTDPSLVAIAKSVLQSAGIEFAADGEFLKGRGVPLMGLFQNIHGVRFLVREEDAEAAEELLNELRNPG